MRPRVASTPGQPKSTWRREQRLSICQLVAIEDERHWVTEHHADLDEHRRDEQCDLQPRANCDAGVAIHLVLLGHLHRNEALGNVATSGTSIPPLNKSDKPHGSATGSIGPTRSSLMKTIPIVVAAASPEATGNFTVRVPPCSRRSIPRLTP